MVASNLKKLLPEIAPRQPKSTMDGGSPRIIDQWPPRRRPFARRLLLLTLAYALRYSAGAETGLSWTSL